MGQMNEKEECEQKQEWESEGFRMADSQNKQGKGPEAEAWQGVLGATNAVLRSLATPCGGSEGRGF